MSDPWGVRRLAARSVLLVLPKPLPQELFAARPPLSPRVVVAIGAMLDTPAIPLAERVVGPVPPVFFEDLDAVPEVPIRAFVRRPPGGAELADVDVNTEVALEVDDGLKGPAKLVLVPT